ncbi:Uncharacterized protein Rs2_02627 [Raphanus sativus]|nr:Uncharacterized protein Rs2_02627 [Raphanus sativus]
MNSKVVDCRRTLERPNKNGQDFTAHKRPKKTCITERPTEHITSSKPKEKPETQTASFHRTSHPHVLKPQSPERRVVDSAVSSSRTARACRRGRNRNFTRITSHPLHPIRRPTLNQTQTEPTGIFGRRTSTAETTSNDNIRDKGFGDFHQGPTFKEIPSASPRSPPNSATNHHHETSNSQLERIHGIQKPATNTKDESGTVPESRPATMDHCEPPGEAKQRETRQLFSPIKHAN